MSNFNIKKDKIIIFLISLGFAGLMLIDTNYWHGIISSSMLAISLFVIFIFIFALLTYSGVIVIKSLTEVSIGLTLIIFLAQAYCSEGVVRTINSDKALMMLMYAGLIYVSFDFLYKIYRTVQEHKKKMKEISWRWKDKAIYIFGLVFVICFIALVYMVINPTIHGLCVYR